MGPLLRRPWLWHMNRRRVAIGASIGVFFGFMVPVLQIAGAALFAALLRANLPVAAFATLVSNPLIYAPIGLLAYQTGSALLGEPAGPAVAQALDAGDALPVDATAGWFDKLQAIGKPLLLGLAGSVSSAASPPGRWCTCSGRWACGPNADGACAAGRACPDGPVKDCWRRA